MKNDSKSTDRIFQLYGVPALMAPANLLYRFDCNEWHTSQPINADDFLEKNKFDSFFSKFIIYHSFCLNLSFDWLWTVLSVGVHMGRHISEHYCLKQAWIKHTFTPTEGETYSKLQLFLFTSSVSIALYAFVRGKGCVCVEHRPSVGVDGCRWVSMGVDGCRKHCNWTFDALCCLMVRCVCVCVRVRACFMLMLVCGGFSDRT